MDVFRNTTGEVKIDQTFAQDVEKGLSSSPKYLPSMYFYDEKGDKLFQQIMNMPEYYLTNAEYEIFDQNKQEIADLFNENGAFELIEFGAGDGFKTKVLLRYFLQQALDFKYMPVDISENVLDILKGRLAEELPGLEVSPLVGEYFQALKGLSEYDKTPKVILFLGSNIGNFSQDQSITFFKELRSSINVGDKVMVGVDLKKDPEQILLAYNDPHGITRAFNLNLLHRINRELGGNFNTEKFSHYPTYDPVTGEARSYLISKGDQEVAIEALDKTFHFSWYEPIFMEVSRKYDILEIENIASNCGFSVRKHLFDCKSQFTDTIWEAV